jgi:hypothetical protein
MALLLSATFVSAVLAQDNANPALQQFNSKMAATKSMEFEGMVLSHDVMCHCFVVATNMGNLILQDDYTKFDQEYNKAKGLMIGAKVRGEYKTVDFLNYALDVEYVK